MVARVDAPWISTGKNCSVGTVRDMELDSIEKRPTSHCMSGIARSCMRPGVHSLASMSSGRGPFHCLMLLKPCMSDIIIPFSAPGNFMHMEEGGKQGGHELGRPLKLHSQESYTQEG